MKSSARGSRVVVSADARGLVSQARAVLLWETLRVTGLGGGLSAALQQWRVPPLGARSGEVVADLAAALALGGACLADIALLREQSALAGLVASDPVVSRLVRSLAADGPRVLEAVHPVRLTSQNSPHQERRNPRAHGTPPTRRDSQAARHDAENQPSQASASPRHHMNAKDRG